MSGTQQGLTPLMQQYFDLKATHEDALLLFQVGDFYELFFSDAQQASSFLGIALTKRGNVNGEPIPLCGFPMHAVDHYVPRLVKGGFKVALCQQLEEAVAGKMVRRGITQVFTPGTLTSDILLDAKSASYLFAFFPGTDGWGLVFSELMTSQLYATVIPTQALRSLETELFRFLPDEVVLQDQRGMSTYHEFFRQRGFVTSFQKINEEPAVVAEVMNRWYGEQFDAASVDFIGQHEALNKALQVWHAFLRKNQEAVLPTFKKITLYEPEEFLQLDAATLKNLDIVKNSFDGTTKNSLFSSIDYATTSMGSRMLKKWLLHPVVSRDILKNRHNVVEYFVTHQRICGNLRSLMAQCADVERIVGRIALQKSQLKDYVALASVLEKIPELQRTLAGQEDIYLTELVHALGEFSSLTQLLLQACNDDFEHDYIIKRGYDAHLDTLRDLVENSSQKILELERAEQARTGINSLKIRSNNVQGYYIEITKTHVDAIPDDYIRQQTLVGKERYTTLALQHLAAEIAQAIKNITLYEREVYEEVKEQVRLYVTPLRMMSQSLAQLDALMGLAFVAYEQNYVRPQFHESQDICIEQGRHPVIAQTLKTAFIANDTQLTDAQALWIVTGPNMGGKSTYLRQVATICLLAQMGSFVPAAKAQLPILDRIFTRIGAGDHLAEGKSTFLVEMEETAQICLQATPRSLVILDEVGRGTSTFDGLALAQAIVEYIYTTVQARCLFATHYHELTELTKQHAGIVSYFMASKKTAHGIVFLHQIVRGTADGSFGIDVAKLARLPQPIIARAQTLLSELHTHGVGTGNKKIVPSQQTIWDQSATVQELERTIAAQQAVILYLKSFDVNTLSPKQAFDILWDLQEKL